MQLWLQNRMQYNRSRRKSKTRPKQKNTINAMFTSLWHIGGLHFWLGVQTCVIFSKSDDFTWSLFWLIISFEIERNEPSGIGRIAVADAGFQLFISGPTSTTVCNKMSTFIQRDFLAPQKTFNIFFAIFHVKLKLNVVKQHRTAVFSRFFFTFISSSHKCCTNCYLYGGPRVKNNVNKKCHEFFS